MVSADENVKRLMAEPRPQTELLRHLNVQANLARREAGRLTTSRPTPLRLAKRAVSQG